MLKIRLQRRGRKKMPFYKIVVANANSPRDGKYIESIGRYDPLLPRDSEQRVVLNTERASYWLGCGAQPTEKIKVFFNKFSVAQQ